MERDENAPNIHDFIEVEDHMEDIRLSTGIFN